MQKILLIKWGFQEIHVTSIEKVDWNKNFNNKNAIRLLTKKLNDQIITNQSFFTLKVIKSKCKVFKWKWKKSLKG